VAAKGMVYYWDHQTEHSPPSHDNVHMIAETLLDSIHCVNLKKIGGDKPV
jgi:hypothetical protein